MGIKEFNCLSITKRNQIFMLNMILDIPPEKKRLKRKICYLIQRSKWGFSRDHAVVVK